MTRALAFAVEAASIRRYLHASLASTSSPFSDKGKGASAAVALYTLSGSLLDSSGSGSGYSVHDASLRAAAQPLRFFDLRVHFGPSETALLLRALGSDPPQQRKGFCDAVLRCRRRGATAVVLAASWCALHSLGGCMVVCACVVCAQSGVGSTTRLWPRCSR